MVLLEFGDVGVYESSEEALGEKLTLHEVIAREFATVKAPLLEVVTWLCENVRVRPGFAELVERYRAARRLERLPRADRADPGARGRRGRAARESARSAAGRLARHLARRGAVPGLRRAVQAGVPRGRAVRLRRRRLLRPLRGARGRARLRPRRTRRLSRRAGRGVHAVRDAERDQPLGDQTPKGSVPTRSGLRRSRRSGVVRISAAASRPLPSHEVAHGIRPGVARRHVVEHEDRPPRPEVEDARGRSSSPAHRRPRTRARTARAAAAPRASSRGRR